MKMMGNKAMPLSILIGIIQCTKGQIKGGSLFIDNIAFVVAAFFLLSLILFVLYDRHNKYRYLIAFRAKIGQLKMSFWNLKNSKKQKNLKILTQQHPQSCKSTVCIFESQKVCSNTELYSVQYILPISNNIQEIMHNKNMMEQQSQINMKEVFQNKETGKGKSKSRLRGRVQIKKQFNYVSAQGLQTQQEEQNPDQNNIME